MKNVLIAVLTCFSLNFAFCQEKAIALTTKNFKGDYKGWAIEKGKSIYLKDIYYLINVKEYILIFPKSQENNEVEITSNFLSSRHTTGINKKNGTPIYKFEFDKKNESKFILQGYYRE